jgi:hypothetical protein
MSGPAEKRTIASYHKDYYGGGLMMLLGAGAIYRGMDYQVGTLTQMGAGYFPVSVGAVMVAMGGVIFSGARRQPARSSEKRQSEWRGWGCIVLAYIAFVLVGRFGGLVPATFAVTFIAALGDRKNTLRGALVLSISMVAVSVVVFSWALQMQFPLFRWG